MRLQTFCFCTPCSKVRIQPFPSGEFQYDQHRQVTNVWPEEGCIPQIAQHACPRPDSPAPQIDGRRTRPPEASMAAAARTRQAHSNMLISSRTWECLVANFKLICDHAAHDMSRVYLYDHVKFSYSGCQSDYDPV